MKKRTWNYNGDLNIEYGGFWWREDGAEDYVLAVRVTPCVDAGGPDNCYWVEQGSIYMPLDSAKRHSALQVCGYEDDPAPTRSMLVDAFMAYGGIERHTFNGERVVQVGKKTSESRETITPDVVLRGNASLRNYVKREYL